MADVAVIVPTVGRPHNAKPFLDSLQASTDPFTVYAIVNDAETAEAWRNHPIHPRVYWFAGDLTFVQGVNYGYHASFEPWVFFVGDDVVFHAGWFDNAMRVAKETGAKVIGTNDLGAGCVNGDFSPHLLIERTYIEEQGSSWDGPGILCTDDYRHNYIDVELAAVAQLRGVWAFAADAIVEHRHAIYGKAEDDATYRRGQSFVDADARAWRERSARFGAVRA